MTTETTKDLLFELNAFRTRHGLKPFAAWKGTRHLPMLDTYRADAEKQTVEAESTPKQKRGPTSGAPTTKKALVRDMLAEGTTLATIASTLQIGPIAARSLIGDVKRMGIKVVRDGAVYRAGE